MGWAALTPATVSSRIPSVKVSLQMSKRGVVSLGVTLNMQMVEKLDWQTGDRVSAAAGEGEHAGWLRIAKADDGMFKPAILKFLARLKLPDVPGSPEGTRKAEVCEHEVADDGALLVRLPWAGTSTQRLDPDDLPPGIERDLPPISIDGKVAMIGKAVVRDLEPKLATILQHLASKAPNVLRKDALHTLLYGDDNDGGPDLKGLDVQICKLRAKLKDSPVDISTECGTGWRLVVRP